MANPIPLQEPVCASSCIKFKDKGCDRNCTDAKIMLSSEGEGYPIEDRIAPLVFELKRIGFYTPCWSCEGHLDNQGKIWKLPRVWFYANKMSHVRVLTEAIKKMSFQGDLNVEWDVKLIPSEENNLDTRFSLQPNIEDNDVSLSKIQEDVDLIAKNLFDVISKQASKLVSVLD